MLGKPGQQDRFQILAFVWHQPFSVITAGGFVRTREILKRIPDSIQLHIFENDPSIFSDLEKESICVHVYRMPKALRRLGERFFFLERSIEWLLSFLCMAIASLRLKSRGMDFDAIYVPGSEVVPALMAGLVAKWIFKKPLVACNMNIELFSPQIRKFVVMLHNRATTIITLSEDLAGALAANGVKAPVLINGVGLDTGPIAEATGGMKIEKAYEAIFVGRHSAKKGIFDLMEVWGIVTERIPSARLILVGSCSPPNRSKLMSLVREYGLENAVVLKGTVDEGTKYRLIKESKVCLFPSYLEGWGITPQEALACGLPVVTYDLPVYRENIRPCGSVYTVPVGDYEEMAQKTIELLSSQRYDEFEEIGPCFVRRFSWDEVADREFRLIIDGTEGR